MRLPFSPRRLRARWCCAVVACVSVGATHADVDLPYIDKEIPGLATEPVAEGEQVYDSQGWPRYLQLDARVTHQAPHKARPYPAGIGILGMLETPNFGSLSLDGVLSTLPGEGTLTLRQRAMPLSSGWFANNEVGVINSLIAPLARLPARIILPSVPLKGLSTELEDATRDTQWQFSMGRPGRLDEAPTTAFIAQKGMRASMAAQWHLPQAQPNPLAPYEGWTWAIQGEDAQDIDSLYAAAPSMSGVHASSALVLLRHESAHHHVQAQWLQTHQSDLSGTRQGHWIDGRWREGAGTHSAGFYRLAPQLTWGGMPLAEDISGAYLRTQWLHRQWSVDASMDVLRSISGSRDHGTYSTVRAQRRLSKVHQVSAGATYRDYGDRAWLTHADWRVQNDWGQSGFRLEAEGGQSQQMARRFIYDQDWHMTQGWSLSTTLGWGQYGPLNTLNLPAEQRWRGAVSFNAPISAQLQLRGVLNTEQGGAGQSQQHVNVAAEWRLSDRWRIEGSYVFALGRQVLPPQLDPLAPPLPVNDKGRTYVAQALLRYSYEAGTRAMPLGGTPKQGGGRISGVIYFDQNRSLTQEASEQGAPNVLVYLDDRFVTRTDAQGRFEFPLVSTGRHVLVVRGDTLPLPWTAAEDGRWPVEVRLRENHEVALPLQRLD